MHVSEEEKCSEMSGKKLYLVAESPLIKTMAKIVPEDYTEITPSELDKLIEKFIRNHQQTKLTEDYSRAILKEFVRDYLLKKLEGL